MAFLRDILATWKTAVILCTPVVALPILYIDGSKEMACLYGVVIIATFWITEALPLAVTSLSPVIIFSMLGVLPSKVIATSFVKDTSIYSIACLSFALCVERWKLHRRIALRGMMMMGSSPKWLMLGFMLPTWFLSMWVNNTSATAMMIPIVMAVLRELRQLELVNKEEESEMEEIGGVNDDTKELATTDISPEDGEFYHTPYFKNLCKALSLCICYSASIGGSGSLTGTSTNLIAQGQAEEVFSAYGLDSGVNFLSWLVCALPVSAICLLIAWLWLLVHFFGVKELFKCGCGGEKETKATRRIIQRKIEELGAMSFAEKAVIGHFVVLVTLWLSMKLPGGSGWHTYFKQGYVNNSTPSVLILASLFLFPSRNPWKSQNNADSEKNSETSKQIPTLLEWKTIEKEFPWGTFCLIGGGFAMAATCQKSGLSEWIGLRLAVLSSVQPWLMLIILTIIISFLTEITSNAATASILSPILAELALTLGMNPLYLMIPGALSCSMAFMLPVATPPNTIVFASGHIKAKDMVKAGFILNILCVLVINLGVRTWISAYFHLQHLPAEMSRVLTGIHTQDVTSLNNTFWPGNVTL